MTALPAREYLDEAAKAASGDRWDASQSMFICTAGIVAHARALEEKAALAERLAKYEPPVDPITAEVRECIALMFAAVSAVGDEREARHGGYDNDGMAEVLRIRIAREKEHPL